MHLRLPWDLVRSTPRSRQLVIGDTIFPVDIMRHRWARRYVIRVTTDGRLRLTVPRGASIDGGLRFAASQHDWIVREWRRQRSSKAAWRIGTLVWYRGDRLPIAPTEKRSPSDPSASIARLRMPISVRRSNRIFARVRPSSCRRGASSWPRRAGSTSRASASAIRNRAGARARHAAPSP